MSKTIVITITLILLVGMLCFFAAGQQNTAHKKNPPMIDLNLGPISLSVAYNQTKLNDKLRLSKSFIKYSFKSPFLAKNEPFMAFKYTFIEELIRCDELTLDKPKMITLIDCRPLETLVLNENITRSSDTVSGANYVNRVTIKSKSRIRREIILIAHLYPLQADFVKGNIKSILAENNQASRTFGQQAENYGFYLEINHSNKVSSPLLVTANVFASVGQKNSLQMNYNTFISELMAFVPEGYKDLFTDMHYPEILFKINVAIEGGIENGLIFGIKDLTYSIQDLGLHLESSFTLIKRNEFPYLTCNHTIKTLPLSELWTYTGHITQSRENELVEYPYYTNIEMDSSSVLFDFARFVLSQGFIHYNESSGDELMMFAHKFASVAVRGDWSAESFSKVLRFYDPLIAAKEFIAPKLSDILAHMAVVTPYFEVKYSDKQKDDFVSLSFQVKKTILDSLVGEESPRDKNENVIREEL